MLALMFAIVCFFGLAFMVLLLRSFEFMSESELKRQARKGNKQAAAVYSVRGVYGTHVFVLIWSLIGLTNAGLIILLESQLWTGVALIISATITIVVHAVLPWSRYPEPSLSLAALSAPVLARILAFLRPVFLLFEKLVGPWIAHGDIHRIHSKEELLDLLERSEVGEDKIGKDEFLIATHALTFGDKTVTQIMTPRSVVKMLKADEVLTPVALGELHESGYSRFPVVSSVTGAIVGTLYMKDIVSFKTSKYIKDVMREDVFFVNEFSSLDHVLNAFLRTKHHLFMVVNEFEEVTGIVTIEDVIEQILGKKIVDEFDQYADMRAVARQKAEEAAKHRHGNTV